MIKSPSNLTDVKPLTERRIQRAMLAKMHHRSLAIPNYTPSGWWENDICEITKSGYWREYEIKLTAADFRRDQEKTQLINGTSRWEVNADGKQRMIWDTLKKHDALKDTQGGPVEFYYVVPTNLLTSEQVPAWAGLIEVYQGPYSRVYWRIVKRAPRRHRRKVDEAVRRQMLETCYWRFHDLLAKLK